ncbi:hypothetical protein YC2023_048931 [Brassica napus]
MEQNLSANVNKYTHFHHLHSDSSLSFPIRAQQFTGSMARMYRKLATCGGEGGSEWDDDVYEGVRKVYVGQDLSRITYIKFDYVKFDGEVVTREYGTESQHPKEFEVQYPDEHIISVEGSYKKVDLYATDVITSLVFKTSKGRKSPMFGPNLLGLRLQRVTSSGRQQSTTQQRRTECKTQLLYPKPRTGAKGGRTPQSY